MLSTVITGAVVSSAAGEAIKGVMRFVMSIAARVLNHQKSDSLVRFTKVARVEPIALIDQRLVHQPYMPDIMQSLVSIFTGYYLQAVSLAVNVGSVNVVRLLDALNPTRDVGNALAVNLTTALRHPDMQSLEAYRYGLPSIDGEFGLEAFGEDAKTWMKKGTDANIKAVTSTQHQGFHNQYDNARHTEANQQEEREYQTAKAARDVRRAAGEKLPPEEAREKKKIGAPEISYQGDVKEAVNLSVGKLIEVTIEDEGKKAMFPISFRIISTIVGADILAHILGDGMRNITLRERWHSWRAGQLEFINDLILCQDLMDEHRRALLKDKTGAYADILTRRQNNMRAGALSNTPSVGSASNLIVISAQTARELERKIHGKLSNPQVRDGIFEHTYIMIMVVVDTDWEQVTFYHRGIATATEMSLKELKGVNKNNGPDVAEILKAYQLGQHPL